MMIWRAVGKCALLEMGAIREIAVSTDPEATTLTLVLHVLGAASGNPVSASQPSTFLNKVHYSSHNFTLESNLIRFRKPLGNRQS